MSLSRIVLASLTAAAMAVAILLFVSSSDDKLKVNMTLPRTGGLVEGSDVRVAGTQVGRVEKLTLDDNDNVKMRLALDNDKARLGSDASATIKAANLLGQKFIQLDPGNQSRPMQDGAAIARSRVTFPTDLDEVLNVLDADTRTRFAILINQAGLMVTGRKLDFNQVLYEAPRSIGQATRILDDLSRDNRALAQLIERSDGWVGRFEAEREPLGDVIGAAGETMTTFVTKRDELRQTLAKAPGMLRDGRGFLADLERAVIPLEPVAVQLREVSPILTKALQDLPAFGASFSRDIFRPAIDLAGKELPTLKTLTPVLREAIPTLNTITRLGTEGAAGVETVRLVEKALLGLIEGWGRATQNRDGFSHFFHGEIGVGADFFRSLLARASGRSPFSLRTIGAIQKKAPGPARSDDTAPATTPQSAATQTGPTGPTGLALPAPVQQTKNTVDKLLGGILGGLGKPGAQAGGNPEPQQQDKTGLLDFLMRP